MSELAPALAQARRCFGERHTGHSVRLDVVFAPTGIRGLPVPIPSTGSAPLEITGNLTIREATRPLTWEGTATFNGAEIGVRARTAFRFADFDLRVPRVSVVLSVDDRIGLEADLLLRRSP